MFKKFMLKKRNKKRGFTLIELIIVIAIIAILAAIAVPAFGKIRQNANESADLANARTIFSVVSTEIANESITLPAFDATKNESIKYYNLEAVGEGTAVSIKSDLSETSVKQYPNYKFVVSLDSNGDIAVGIASAEASGGTAPANYQFIYGDESHTPKTVTTPPAGNDGDDTK